MWQQGGRHVVRGRVSSACWRARLLVCSVVKCLLACTTACLQCGLSSSAYWRARLLVCGVVAYSYTRWLERAQLLGSNCGEHGGVCEVQSSGEAQGLLCSLWQWQFVTGEYQERGGQNNQGRKEERVAKCGCGGRVAWRVGG
jgi:hypothetical protein